VALPASHPLPREFYERSPERVAEEILGRVVASLGPRGLRACAVVEAEAYFGEWDPASRASMHRRGRIVERLRGPVGVALVYGVHRQWLLNIVAHEPGGVGAVLLRACQPLTPGDPPPRGPGRLTRFLGVDRGFDGLEVYRADSPLRVLEARAVEGEVVRGRRVGVRRDLEEPMRFCIKGSEWLSRPC
jgi:DNA-3-methyladenine glycosylase